MSKVYTRFQTKRRKNPTLWGGTYLYGLYKEVPPLPQGPILQKVDSVSVVVQLYPWFKFYFLLFRGMVSMIMSLKQTNKKIKPSKDKIAPQHIHWKVLSRF